MKITINGFRKVISLTIVTSPTYFKEYSHSLVFNSSVLLHRNLTAIHFSQSLRKVTVLRGESTVPPVRADWNCLSNQLPVCWESTLLSPSYVTVASWLLRMSPRFEHWKTEKRVILVCERTLLRNNIIMFLERDEVGFLVEVREKVHYFWTQVFPKREPRRLGHWYHGHFWSFKSSSL